MSKPSAEDSLESVGNELDAQEQSLASVGTLTLAQDNILADVCPHSRSTARALTRRRCTPAFVPSEVSHRTLGNQQEARVPGGPVARSLPTEASARQRAAALLVVRQSSRGADATASGVIQQRAVARPGA